MVKRKRENDLVVKPIPVPIQRHPIQHDLLPVHEFTMGIIAPKGAGKTTIIANLLNFYKKYFHAIFIFSPSVTNDEKWDWVKKQNLLAENKALKNWIEKINDKQKKLRTVVEPPPVHADLENYTKQPGNEKEEFDPKIPEECFIAEYNEQTLQSYMDQQQQIIDLLKSYDETKYLANRILFIFDDLVGSTLFSASKENPFKRMNVRHRHFSFSMLMVTQAYKEIPKTVRLQFSALILFEITNEKEVEVIYEEQPVNLSKIEWLETYRHAVEGDHNFMYINYQKPKRLRVMKNFDQILFHDTDPENTHKKENVYKPKK
jgi:hypothetical protein